MRTLAARLRKRAGELKISNNEAARRAGLSTGRYGHYIRGRSEPDFATLMRIAEALETTPDALMGFKPGKRDRAQRSALRTRLTAAANALSDRELEILVVEAEAVAAHVGSSGR
jgi:transcriptional regulator with XRE-family HTH domain